MAGNGAAITSICDGGTTTWAARRMPPVAFISASAAVAMPAMPACSADMAIRSSAARTAVAFTAASSNKQLRSGNIRIDPSSNNSGQIIGDPS
jgi:hypothetical protein